MTPDHAAALAVLDRITKGDWRWTDQYADTKGQRTWSLLGKGGYGILSCDGTANSPQGLGDAANARVIAALPELAALYRASVELMAAQKALEAAEDFYRATFKADGDEASAYYDRVSPARVRLSEAWIAFAAALAAVADKLTKGEGK